MSLIEKFESRSRPFFMGACVAFLGLVGLVDFLSGFEMFFSVFYLLSVGVGTWFIGRGFGLFMSALSATAWIAGDLAAGARYANSFVPVWNTAILLAFYFIVVWLLSFLRALQNDLESRVKQRTVALTQEMHERERLEKEILQVSEREQRRIGRDLHDGICQHFTATALAGRVLEEKLAAKTLPEARDAANIVGLVEDGIALARNLARGISPVELEAEGLVAAFHEMAANLNKLSKVQCVFQSDARVSVSDASTATHLYRIAQEAVTNAIRHGKANRIDISVANRNGFVTLAIEDDGVGLPDTWQTKKGLGTRIMAHRATMIDGSFSIEPNPTGGTLVKCVLPAVPQPGKETQMVHI
jgi:signal transduction histidine kinase